MSNNIRKSLAFGLVGAAGLIYVLIPQGVVSRIAVGCGGVLFGASAAQELRKSKLSTVLPEAKAVFDEVMLGKVGREVPAPVLVPIDLQQAEAFLKGQRLHKDDPTTPDFWTLERAKRNRIMLGQGSSGKSFLSAFMNQILIKNGVHLKIADPHYDSIFRDGRQKTDWVPGLPEKELRERYLITDMDEIYSYLVEFAEEAHRRLNGEAGPNPVPMFYSLDEWNKFIREWNKSWVNNALEIFHFLADEGDKADMHFGLSLHSLTEKKSRLDSSIRMFCDHYMMGASLANTSNTFPDGFKPGELLRQVKKTYSEKRVVHQRVMGFWSPDMEYTDGCVLVGPQLPAPINFLAESSPEEIWLQENEAEIYRLVREDFGRFRHRSNVGDELKAGARSNSNPIWVALREAHARIVAEVEAELHDSSGNPPAASSAGEDSALPSSGASSGASSEEPVELAVVASFSA